MSYSIIKIELAIKEIKEDLKALRADLEAARVIRKNKEIEIFIKEFNALGECTRDGKLNEKDWILN